MKLLRLTLKKKWFDMIASGEKKEEYREIKPYWMNRLQRRYYDGMLDERGRLVFNHFDAVKFTNGYAKNSRSVTLECLGIEKELGMLSWGAEKDTKYFVIKLGEIINLSNEQSI